MMPTARQAFQLFQVMRYGAMLLTGVVFARAGLGTFDIGIYEALMFLGSLLSFWWLSGITQALLAVPDGQGREGRSVAFFNVFVVLSMAGVLLFVLFRLLVTPYTFATNKPDLLAHYASFSWYLLLVTPVYLLEHILLLKEKPAHLLAYGAVAFGGQLLLMGLPVVLGRGLGLAIDGLVIVAFGRWVLLWVALAHWAIWRIDKSYLVRFAAQAWPLAAGTLLSGSAEYLDGLIVSRFFSEETFAIYRYGAKELPLALVLAAAFSNSMVPQVAKVGAAQTAYNIKQGSTRLMHLFFGVALVLMVAGPWLYPRVFNADFSGSAPVFCTYLLLVVPRVLFPQTMLIGLGHAKAIMANSAIELGVNVAVSFALMPFWGITGIAVGTVVAACTDKAIATYKLRRLANIPLADIVPIKTWLTYTVALCALYAVVMGW